MLLFFGTASSQDAVAMDSLLGDVQTGHFIPLVLRCREVAVKNLATAEASLQSMRFRSHKSSVSGIILNAKWKQITSVLHCCVGS